MHDVKIDSEFESLVPPMTDDEYRRLERSILAYGVRAPIITWNGVILDGHSRYKICKKHGIEFETREVELDTRADAMRWIVNKELLMRNFTPARRQHRRH